MGSSPIGATTVYRVERLMPPVLGRGAFCYSGVMDEYGRPGNEKYAAERAALQERFPKTGRFWRGIDIGDGWMPIVIELDRHLLEIKPDYELHQVKEKFGGLRYYVGEIPEEGQTLIDVAEALSYQTCENCGEPGKESTSGGYWLKTLCDKCDAERTARRASG
jgi:hypothetical protein